MNLSHWGTPFTLGREPCTPVFLRISERPLPTSTPVVGTTILFVRILFVPLALRLVLSFPFYYGPAFITAILCDFIPFCDEFFKIVPLFATNRIALRTIPASHLFDGYDQMAFPATKPPGFLRQKGHCLVAAFAHERKLRCAGFAGQQAIRQPHF